MKRNIDIEKMKKTLTPVLRRYDVVRAGIFGSFAKGYATRRSDLDILVEFNGEKSLLDLAALKISLEKLLNRKVDVLTYDSIYHLIKKNILSEQLVIL